MDSDNWLYLSSIIILIVLSAFFSSSEIAYASANKMRLKKGKENGGLRWKWAQTISDRYDEALCTLLMGNNLVNMGASSLATVFAISLVGEVGAVYATVAMTVVLLIFGEILPKQIGKQKSDTYILFVAPIIRFLMIITKPLVSVVMSLVDNVSKLWGGEGESVAMTEDELVTIIETVEEEGIIDEERSDLLQSAIEFGEIEAEEIIIHRVDILSININDSFEEMIEIANNSPFSRIPVYEGNIDNIIGVLSLNHLYKALIDHKEVDVKKLISEVCYVHKSKKLPVVLNEMQRRKIHMSVVTDDYGGTLGILTMEDILEEIVGEIWDETDIIYNEFMEVADSLYEVDGNLGVSDFLENLDMEDQEFEDDFITMGGWTVDVLGGFPKPGDNFKYRNLLITVMEMNDLRVTKLQVQELKEETL